MNSNGFGWQGRILHVNLSSRKTWLEPTSCYLNKYIGGKSINQAILFSEVPDKTEPFDSENRIVVGTGPLTGTLAPSAGRVTFGSMNVFNKGVAEANAGGHFGPEIKFAGYDHVVIEGQSDKPVFLWIHDDVVEIRDAKDIWGATTWQAEDWIKNELNFSSLHTALIGPAGENKVFGSAIIVDRGRAAARGGIGAVMGSKYLKGIAVKGTGSIRVADTEKFMEATEAAWKAIARSGKQKILHAGGSHLDGGFGANEAGLISVHNGQDAFWDESRMRRVAYPIFKEYYEKRRLACFSCPTFCSHIYELKEGQYAPLIIEGFQANMIWGFGGRLDIADPEKLIVIHSLLSQYGLDNDFASVVIGWAMELFENGILSHGDTDGLDLNWGNGDAVIKLIPRIARREGFGDLLANGVYHASTQLGEETKKYAVHVKGQESLDEIRNAIAWGLGVVVSLKSGGHLEGSTTIEFDGTDNKLAKDFFQISTLDPIKYDEKERIVYWYEQFKQVVDAIGLCYFATSFMEFNSRIDLQLITNLLTSATGKKMSADELMLAGRRAHNLQKAFNTLHAGFTREDDLPPQRFITDPVKSGPHQGNHIDLDKWNQLLSRYYDLHGWDPNTSWPTRRILESLNLPEVIDRLAAINKLGCDL